MNPHTPFTDCLVTEAPPPEEALLATGCDEGDFEGAAVEALAAAVAPGGSGRSSEDLASVV